MVRIGLQTGLYVLAHGGTHGSGHPFVEEIGVVVRIEHENPSVGGEDPPPFPVALECIGRSPGDHPVDDQVERVVWEVQLVRVHHVELAFHSLVLGVLGGNLEGAKKAFEKAIPAKFAA